MTIMLQIFLSFVPHSWCSGPVSGVCYRLSLEAWIGATERGGGWRSGRRETKGDRCMDVSEHRATGSFLDGKCRVLYVENFLFHATIPEALCSCQG